MDDTRSEIGTQNVDAMKRFPHGPTDSLTENIEAEERTGSTESRRRVRHSCTEDDANFEHLLEKLWSKIQQERRDQRALKNVVEMLRDESETDGLDVDAIDVHTSIDSSLVQVRPHIGEGVEVRRSYRDVPFVTGDSELLEHVFTNLLLNSLEAFDGEGAIGISTHMSHDHVCVAVRDTGRGISDEALPYIFDPFFSSRPGGDGIGLGLPISRRIVRCHGGHMDVRSRIGEFTEVRVYLPVKSTRERQRMTH